MLLTNQVYNCDVFDFAPRVCEAGLTLIVADPPYGRITKATWDRDWRAADYIKLAQAYQFALAPGGAMYIWGGVGKPRDRPFFEFLSRVEHETHLTLHALCTWSKKRAYGVADNYLFTREECAVLVRGNKPSPFNIPLTDQLRGYAGYNAKYPAKSPYLRRTMIWNETEIMRGKRHECEKPRKIVEIPILAHTNPGGLVLDLFSGSGSTSEAAQAHGRKWIAVEAGEKESDDIARNLDCSILPEDYDACSVCERDHSYGEEGMCQ